MRQYIVRCPASETPSQEHLISCFLEGLRNQQLYMHLFAKNHADFDECCFDAQKFDDNCDLFHDKPNQDSIESGESSKNMETHALVDLILQKLRQELNLIQPSHMYDPRVPHQGQTKWCEFCRTWTNHEMFECQNRERYLRERAFQALHSSIKWCSNA